MKCVICKTNDWENVDWAREKPAGMCICKNCGFISYPEKWKSEEEIKAYYRKNYRKPPTHQNIFTCQRKVNFHQAFLEDLFKEWDGKNKTAPVIGEIGAAFGMALEFFKSVFPNADISGTELTTSFRRVAFHEFGIKLTEDFDDTKKYDLLMSYKVAEHQLDIDQFLLKYRNALKDDGLLYISVPTWFSQLNNFGMGGFDLEYYYEPAHINVWTREHFELLLAQSGLEIVKQDHVMYGDTYLCKKSSAQTVQAKVPSPEMIKEKLKAVKKASELVKTQDFRGAIHAFPNFPLAWNGFYEMNRKVIHANGWDFAKTELFDPAIAACGDSAELYILLADVAMRFEKFDTAEVFAKKGLECKPKNPVSIGQMCNILREMALRADGVGKIEMWKEAKQWSDYLRATSLQNFAEGTDMSFIFAAQMPIPGEA